MYAISINDYKEVYMGLQKMKPLQFIDISARKAATKNMESLESLFF